MTSPMRRVVYLSGTRADFGLMRATLARVAATPGLSLQVLVTGMHLSPEHGRTVDEIRAAGFAIAGEIPLDMRTRTGESMSLGIADCLKGVTGHLARLKPDLLLLLGDRGEMLAGAIAALHLGIPCVHLHGGERSGTVDEPVRHAISKLATHHFVATPGSRERLIAMGEDPARIHVTGAPGLDGLRELGAMPRADCLQALGLAADARFILVAFHPVVQQAADAQRQAAALAGALAATGLPLVWLEPNADAGALGVLAALDAATLPAGSRRVTHLPRPLFVAAMAHCELLAGNSSAGIIEAATFGTPVLNVGDRQRLRERAPNVVDAAAQPAALAEGLARVRALGRGAWDNPYGDGQAAARIAGLLASLPLDPALLEKTNTY
ncbi:UDP-N-acetylglucosamine 2-epimerase [Ramlibacter sp. MAHUQ-53]|uniref:UDP-N-acetylglucosamine 2-epimerase n=1 Tax=unclassified Ramlibacter TaxID=2617605 RepID=UPI0036338F06